MAKKQLNYDNFAQIFEAIPDMVKRIRGKGLVIVPEKYTLRLERALFSGSGSFTVEVTTVSRLYRKICGGTPALSREGAVMIIKGILGRLKLEYYEKSKNSVGFASKIYDTVKSLDDAGISPEELQGEKLKDVALIYAEFLKQTEELYGGSAKRVREIIANLGYFKGKEVIIAAFNGYTENERQLFDAVCGVTDVTIMEKRRATVDTISTPACVVEAVGQADMLKIAAKKIRNAFLDGLSPKDIAVVSPPLSYERLKRIFTEYEIPFFIDVKKSLAFYPEGELICLLSEGAENGYSRESLVKLAKNPLSGLSKTQSDCFELYTEAFGIERERFFESFVKESEYLEEATAAREKLLDIIFKFQAAENQKEFCPAIIQFLCGARAKINRTSDENIVEKISTLAGIIDEAGIGQNRAELLAEVIRDTLISELPAGGQKVYIGDPSLFRGQRPKLLVLLGCNEGQIPAFIEEGGILCDADIEKINGDNPRIAARNEINEREDEEITELAELSGEVFAIYNAASEAKKSEILDRLVNRKRILPADTEYDCCSCAAALEKLITSVATFRAGGEFDASAGAIYYALEGRADKYISGEPEFACRQRGGTMINNGTYISQLQTFFDCPAKHFFRYGLKINRREVAGLTPIDIGNIMHKIIELVIASGQYSDIEGEVKKASQTAISLSEKGSLEINDDLLKKIIDESKKVIGVFVSHLKKGEFSGAITETEFGNADFKGVELPCDPPVTLRGKIDMTDFYGNAARVIDYKTGRACFSKDDIYYGKKIQLPLYAAALAANGFKPIGMFYFPLKSSWKDDEFSHRLSGVFSGGTDTALIMDKTLAQGGKSEVIAARTMLKKDGELSLGKSCASALTPEQFDAILDYSLKIAAKGVDLIRQGYCKPSPMEARFDVCSSCDYFCDCPGAVFRRSGSVSLDSFVADSVKENDNAD